MQADRIAWLSSAESLGLAHALGVAPTDVQAIARLGAAALAAGRLDRADQVFSALVALEPSQSAHRFHLAVVHQQAHRHSDARQQLDVVVADHHAPPSIRREALQLRAQLRAADDRPGALSDLAEALTLVNV